MSLFKAEHLTDTLLKRFAMEVPAGQFLFKQNDKGNTMFILVEGKVDLYHKTLQNERMVGTLIEGEIVGEKTILSPNPYKRAFTAKAQTNVTVLQFDHQSLKAIQTKMPDFTTKLLSVVLERLERANQMVSILQLTDPVERVVMYMLHCCEHYGKKTQLGTELLFKTEDASVRINVGVGVLKSFLDELVAEKIITMKGDTLTLANETALLQHVPAIKERIAA